MPHARSVSRFSRTRVKTERARRLRRDMTEAEKQLWRKLKGNELAGLGFRRQHPAGPYLLDFYCPAVRLAVEVDGSQHGEDDVLAQDARRTAYLKSRGIEIIRFWNAEIFGDLDGVLETILDLADSLRRSGK